MLESSLTELEQNSTDLVTPGSQLKASREAAGLTIKDVAAELKLTVTYIIALEDDHYEALPAEPFVLGYLRAYARLVELDAQALIDCYHAYGQAVIAMANHLSVSPEPSKVAVKRKAKADSGTSDNAATETEATPLWRKPYLWLALGLGAWVVATQFMVEAPSADVSAALNATASSEPVLASAPATDAMAAGTTAIDDSAAVVEVAADDALTEPALSEKAQGETASRVENPAADSTAAEDAVIISDEVANPVLSANGADLDALRLAFSEECWLEVTDSRGDVLNADLYQAGQSKTLYGKAPFDVMIGNVRAVKASLNEQALTLTPDGFRKTLRFRVTSPGDIKVLKRIGGQ